MPDQNELARLVREAALTEPLQMGHHNAKTLQRISEHVAARSRRLELRPLLMPQVLEEAQRANLMERLERAQAERGARLVRAAAEALLNAPAPIVSPDTTWSGDFGVLLDLCNLGVRRARYQYEQRARGYGRTQRRVHEQP